jgi:hypothetical protein
MVCISGCLQSAAANSPPTLLLRSVQEPGGAEAYLKYVGVEVRAGIGRGRSVPIISVGVGVDAGIGRGRSVPQICCQLLGSMQELLPI